MRLLALTLGLALLLTDACADGTTDLVAPPSGPGSISLAADSAVTALDSSVVDTHLRYRCTMGLRVTGSSTISGEAAIWTGGRYQLTESDAGGPIVQLSVGDLVGWFGRDRVAAGEVATTTRTFQSTRRFTAVIVSITVDLVAEGQVTGRPQAVSTSFACG